MTDSRPPAVIAEAQRLAKEMLEHAQDDFKRWETVITGLADIKALLNYVQLRQDLHEKIDDEKFARIFNGQPSISSQVGALKSDHEQIAGAKRILQIVGIFFAWIISTGIAIWAARK